MPTQETAATQSPELGGVEFGTAEFGGSGDPAAPVIGATDAITPHINRRVLSQKPVNRRELGFGVEL